MKNEYIITETELLEKGLKLSDYLLDTTYIPVIINLGLEKCITRILFLNDNFEYEDDIEETLDNEPKLVMAFKKLQYQLIYNLIFLGGDTPYSKEIDDIICSDLRMGKINGWQKQLYAR